MRTKNTRQGQELTKGNEVVVSHDCLYPEFMAFYNANKYESV